MRIRLAVGALLVLTLSATGLPASPAAAAGDRRQAVAGWQVESRSEEDGGRLVRLSRRGRGWRFEYHLAFWHGNGGVIIGATFRRGDCRSGDADAIQLPEAALGRESLDGHIDDYLRECPLPASQAAVLRSGVDAAWPIFSAWAQEAAEATLAEAEAIEHYGE
jgi:hypothetical protein